MRGRNILIIGIGTLLVLFFYYGTFTNENQTFLKGELFISNITGYVAGYPNETVNLNIYWIKAGDSDFSATLGVRNLPSCLESGGVSLIRDTGYGDSRIKEAAISVRLILKEPGRCVMKNAYLEIQQENYTERVPLGRIEFDILEPARNNSLRITSYVGGSIGPEPAVPTLMYTILNPFNKSVEILNVTFNIPGLKVSNFESMEILPEKTINLTIAITNTTKLGNLYIIRPLIVYRVGTETQVMPAETYLYATVPDENKLMNMLGNKKNVRGS